MAEKITLSAYIERIENMIRQGRMDEAIAHSAHVLQFYPKNAVVYRNMGRALVRLQRYDEAGEVFRRLLAAIPDDFSAHYQLSVVYEQENEIDAALWHIERAFDQQPANVQVNERLRELYKKFRDVEVEKIQLTAGAVANQYLKAHMFDEALEILNRTLEKVPDRVDLRLLKTRTLQGRGDTVEAAESALDILATYPFAMEANRILAELWLQEERPSDAQRYLVRVEDVDPFLAFEIAADEAPDDERFMLEELDFTRYAASLASHEQAPDWLSNIDELVEAEEAEPILDLAADTPLDDFDLADDEPEAEMGDSADWLGEIHDDSQPIQPVARKVTDDLSDLLPDDFNFPDSAGTDDTVDDEDMHDLPLFDDDDDLFSDLTDKSSGMTDLFGDLADDSDDDGTGLTGLLGEDDYSTPAAKAENLTGLLGMLSGESQEEDDDEEEEEEEEEEDSSWLEDVSAGRYDTGILDDKDNVLADADSADDFFDGIGASGENRADDPLGWLDTGDLVKDESFDTDEFSTDSFDKPAQAVDPNDPMAWLQSSGIDFDENAEDDYSAAIAMEADEPSTLESREVDPMAWLGGGSDDDASEDAYNLVTSDFGESDSDTTDDANPMEWLAEEGIEFERTGEFEAVDTADFNVPAEDDPLGWLAEGGIELDDEIDGIPAGQVLTDQLGSLDEDINQVEGDPVAWLEDDGVEFLDTDEGEAQDDANWLADDSVLDDLLNIADLTNTTDEEPFDDLLIDTEMQDTMTDEPDFSAEDNFDWIPDEDDATGDESKLEAEDDSMAWLNDDSPVEDDSMAWLEDDSNEISDNSEDFTTNEFEETAADWLEVEAADAMDADLDFLADEEAEPAATSMLDFLSGDQNIDLADIGEISEDDAFGEEESDWLRALDGDEPLASTEADSFTDDFDNLENDASDNIDWGVEDDSGDDGFDWGFDDAEEEEVLDWTVETDAGSDDFAVEGDPQPADADWLSDFGDEQADDSFSDFAVEGDPQPADADWLSDFGDEQADDSFDDFAVEGDPQPADADWLSDLGDEQADDSFDDFAVEGDPQPADADWLSDFGDEQADDSFDDFAIEGDPQPADADWLSDLGDEQADDSFSDFAVEGDPQPADADWLSDLGDEQADDNFDDFAVEGDPQPADADWLSDFGDEQADDSFSDFAVEGDPQPADADWLSDLGDEQADDNFDDFAVEGDPQPADADWLSDLGDEDTDDLVDYEEETAEPVAEESWLSDIGVQEEDAWTDDDYEEYHDDGHDLNIETSGMSEMLDSIRTTHNDDDFEASLDDIDIDEPDWLNATGEFSGVDNDEFDAEEEAFADDFSAQAADETYDDDFISEPELEEAVPLAEADYEEYEEAAEDNFVATGLIEDDEEGYEEDTQQLAAENAPDWLNAMVPGLDLDFEAEDEGYLDEGFEEREHTLRERRINESEIINSDLEWLHDIVEEESSMMEVIEDDSSTPPPPPIRLPQRRVFEFSAPPVWTRSDVVQNIVQSGATEDNLPDYLSDFDDFEEAQDYDLNIDFDDNFEFETDEVAVQDTNFEFEDELAMPSDDTFDTPDDEFDFDDDFDDFDFDDEFDD